MLGVYGGSCSNTNFGGVDPDGYDCSSYIGSNNLYCGSFDDSDFVANEMCCACGGGLVSESPVAEYAGESCSKTNNGARDSQNYGCGSYSSRPEECGDFDDSDFEANEMCCACGGGLVTCDVGFLPFKFILESDHGYGWDGGILKVTTANSNARVFYLGVGFTYDYWFYKQKCLEPGCCVIQMEGFDPSYVYAWEAQSQDANLTYASAAWGDLTVQSFCVYATVCDVGEQPNASDTGCEPCLPGTYSSSNSNGICTPCPASTFNEEGGSVSADSCLPCPATLEYSHTGSSSVTSCFTLFQNLYTISELVHGVLALNSDTREQEVVVTRGGDELFEPRGIAFISPSRFLVTHFTFEVGDDDGNDDVKEYNTRGELIRVFATGFKVIKDVLAIISRGEVAIADWAGKRVYFFRSDERWDS